MQNNRPVDMKHRLLIFGWHALVSLGLLISSEARLPAATSSATTTIASPLLPMPNPRIIGQWPANTGPLTRICVQGALIYGIGDSGVSILDAADPQNPMLISQLLLPKSEKAVDLAVQDGLAFVLASNQSALHIISVAAPTHPAVISTIALRGQSRRVQVRDGLAYVCLVNSSGPGIQVIDVSDTAHPRVVQEFGRAPSYSDIELSGNAVIYGTNNTVLVFNRDGSGKLQQRSAIRVAERANIDGIAAVENLAFIAMSPVGLVVLEISDPDHPVILATVPMASLPTFSGISRYGLSGVSAWKNLVAVLDRGDRASGVHILDVSVPSSPKLTGTVRFPDSRGATFYGTNLLVCTGTGLEFVTVGSAGTPASRSVAATTAIKADGNRLLVADEHSGLHVFHVDNSSQPKLIATHTIAGRCSSLAFGNNLAVLAFTDNIRRKAGLSIVDLTTPESPKELSKIYIEGPTIEYLQTVEYSASVALHSNMVYLGTLYSANSRIDISDPSHPRLVESHRESANLGLQFSGDGRIGVAGQGSGVSAFEVRPNGMLTEWKRYGSGPPYLYGKDLELHEFIAYIAAGEEFAILDFSGTAPARLLSRLPLPSQALALVEHIAYVIPGNDRKYVSVVDCSTTSNPWVRGEIATGNGATAITSDSSRIFLAGPGGLKVIETESEQRVAVRVTKGPADQSVLAGTNLHLRVFVTGTPPVAFRWYRNGVPLVEGGRYSGVATPILQVDTLKPEESGEYHVIVTNAYGADRSKAAQVVVVGDPPRITTFPTNVQVLEGESLVLPASVSGSPPIEFTWLKSGERIHEGPRVSGLETSRMVLSSATTGDAGLYSLRIENPWGVATSAPPARVQIVAKADQVKEGLDNFGLEFSATEDWRWRRWDNVLPGDSDVVLAQRILEGASVLWVVDGPGTLRWRWYLVAGMGRPAFKALLDRVETGLRAGSSVVTPYWSEAVLEVPLGRHEIMLRVETEYGLYPDAGLNDVRFEPTPPASPGSGSALEGLFFESIGLLPDGRVRVQVHTPPADINFVVQYSRSARDWANWTVVPAGGNHNLTSPEPIQGQGNNFLRIVPEGQASSTLGFHFRASRNVILQNGSFDLEWPMKPDSWQAILRVANSTNPPAASLLRLHNSASAGSEGLDIAFESTDGGTAVYESDFVEHVQDPPGGRWVASAPSFSEGYTVEPPESEKTTWIVVPRFDLASGRLRAINLSFRNGKDGSSLSGWPQGLVQLQVAIYGPESRLCGPADNEIFTTTLWPGSSRTDITPALQWTNALVVLEAEDWRGNIYTMNYSFEAKVEVWGANSRAEPDYCDPAEAGFQFLGSLWSTGRIEGSYRYYLIRAPKHSVGLVDTVEGSNGRFYGTSVTGNVLSAESVGGPPDGQSATVGISPRGYHSGGFFLIDAAGDGLNAVVVHLSPR